MILINLLPHREMARQAARRAFNLAMVAAALIGALLAGVIWLWQQHLIDVQNSRNQFLNTEISKLDKQIESVATLEQEIEALRARQDAVEDLQADRNIPTRLLNEAVGELPDGLYLTAITQQGQDVTLEGMAQSNERVSQLLRNIERGSRWVTKPQLVEIVAEHVELTPAQKRRVYKFNIRVHLQRASDFNKDKTDQPQAKIVETAATNVPT